MPTMKPSPRSKMLLREKPYILLLILFLGAFCFQLGLILGSERERQQHLDHALSSSNAPPPSLVVHVDPPSQSQSSSKETRQQQQEDLHRHKNNSNNNENKKEKVDPPPRNAPSLPLVAGVARVNRDDFVAALDIGLPFDMTTTGSAEAKDVLLLYTSKSSVPKNDPIPRKTIANTTTSTTTIPAAKAIENCQSMKVIYTESNVESSCIAIVEFHEAFYVHRFHRVGKVNEADATPPPLRHVSQSINSNGEDRGKGIPPQPLTDKYWKDLVHYLTQLPAALERLAPIARRAAAGNNHDHHHQEDGNNNNAKVSGGGVVVAMAVNYGQSELFANFVCAARARKINLSHVILFASDTETVRLAQSLNIHVFDAQEVYGAAMPKKAAESYRDKTFGRIVLSKIYCVHLLVLLGYDVLLQDVDMIWHRDPLEFFFTETAVASKNVSSVNVDQYDMIFQDDGNDASRFVPLFANTGCYFVRNNERTIFFYNHLIRMGDVIQYIRCDQESMHIVLNEHVSWKGLKVKTLQRDSELGLLFPGGFHFHARPDYMKKLMNGTVEPYVFHMHWTTDKVQKQKFLQQMGEWYVQPECTEKKTENVSSSSVVVSARPGVNASVAVDGAALCCTSEPLIQCNYRDKPSKISCHDSEPLDSEGESFW